MITLLRQARDKHREGTQNQMRFLIQVKVKATGDDASRALEALVNPEAGAGPLSSKIFVGDVNVQVRKTASVFEFSLCLSRACLGKMIVLMYKWHLKNAVFRRTALTLALCRQALRWLHLWRG
jgi:hypothetical protein